MGRMGGGEGGGTLRPIRAMQDIFGVDILAGGLYIERVLGGWMSGSLSCGCCCCGTVLFLVVL